MQPGLGQDIEEHTRAAVTRPLPADGPHRVRRRGPARCRTVAARSCSYEDLLGAAGAVAAAGGGGPGVRGAGDGVAGDGGRRGGRAAGRCAGGPGAAGRRARPSGSTSWGIRARRCCPGRTSASGPAGAGRSRRRRTPRSILYTSGTDGPAQGRGALPRGAIAADLDALAGAWEWTPEDTLVHGLPLFHVHGLVLGVLGALRTGCRLVHTGRPTPQAYAAAGGSLYFGVPTVWSRVVRGRRRRAGADRRPAARLRQRAAALARLPGPGGAHRAAARGAVRHDRDADHDQHPGGR